MFNFFEYIANGKDRVYYRYLDESGNVCEIRYNEFADDVCEVFNYLNRKYGDIRGRHIGVLSNRPYQTMVSMIAAVLGKAVVVPINQYESSENIEYIIVNADVEILMISDDYQKYQAENTVKISEALTGVRNEHFVYDKSMDEFTDDCYLIVYTSGTTGKAKGVVLPFTNITGVVDTDLGGYTEITDKIKGMYLTVPLYHIMGIFYWFGAVRCKWVVQTNQNVGDMLHDLKVFNPELVVATPAFIKMIDVYIRKNEKNELDALRFIIAGGAQLNNEITKRLADMGVMCMDGYAMTETAGAGTINPDPMGHSDSIGIPAPKVEIIFIDGEMCIKSQFAMKGYYNDPEATAECLIDGAMHTGDLGYVAEDGYLYITGRKKNLIILSGGENVSPEELEKKLYADQHIKECKVYEKNDRISAGIFADTEYHDEIRDFVSKLNASLPIFKRINNIDFTDKEFEKTGNGKIKR